MSAPGSHCRALFAVAACAAAAAAAPPASAAVIALEPTLPVLGVPYTSAIAAGCFPLAGVCVTAGSVTPVSVVSSTFDASGQHIVANVIYSGMLTTLANVPLAPLSLSGTMEQEIFGRTFATELGTWSAELVALSLSGALQNNTLTIALDDSSPSIGAVSIVGVSTPTDEPRFAIDSFFDVFVEVTLDTIPPLVTTRGPMRAILVTVPEPGSLMLLGLGLAGIAWIRWRNA